MTYVTYIDDETIHVIATDIVAAIGEDQIEFGYTHWKGMFCGYGNKWTSIDGSEKNFLLIPENEEVDRTKLYISNNWDEHIDRMMTMIIDGIPEANRQGSIEGLFGEPDKYGNN